MAALGDGRTENVAFRVRELNRINYLIWFNSIKSVFWNNLTLWDSNKIENV